MERDGDEVRLGGRDGEVRRFGRVYERQKKKILTRSGAEEQSGAEETRDVGCGGAADSGSSLDVDFVPSINEASADDSFDNSENLLCEEDNHIDEEEVSLPQHNRNANASAVGSSRCMGYSFTADSDYEESDQLREMPDDSEDDADSAIQFNQSTDIDDPKFAVGMIFESFEVLKHAIRNYSIKRRYPVTIKWNDKLRVRAVCGDACPWVLHAAPYKVGRGVCK